MLPEEFRSQLRHVRFCGNYGDPIAAADLPAACALFRSANPKVRITIHTNGGLRDEVWWRRLAEVADVVRFGLDGLADTNHLYRRGVDWDRALRSARAFIGAGGRAEWDFLVFRHNEHQVGEARALAAELGFARFQAKRTKRFLREGRSTPSQPVRGPGGEIEYELEPPVSEAWRNAAVEEAGRAWEGAADYEHYLAETEICCKAEAERELYLSAEGLVFPCCYLAQIHPPFPQRDLAQMLALLAAQPDGVQALSARRRKLCEIVEGPVFRAIEARWGRSPERLRTCAKQCGRRDFFGGQFEAAVR